MKAYKGFTKEEKFNALPVNEYRVERSQLCQ